jgi:glyoxylase-like metal-dependent hydrolase (beta-lactamase superfamily II)
MDLHFPFPDPPAFGQVKPIGNGIHWLRMPLPFALDHINLWLIEHGDGWALIDTGIPDDTSRQLWQAVLAGPMAGRPLTRLVVTHFHPDHMGLAAWLQQQFPVEMEATLAEWLYGRMLSLDTSRVFVDSALCFYRGAGLDQTLLDLVARRGNAYGARVKHVPPTYRRLRKGDELVLGERAWTVMIGEGHAPELACLSCRELNILISSDQVLPSISPNVSIWPGEPDANPLALFLASLAQFRSLPADTLVLPSHGLPFRGLHARVDELAVHHRERLDETWDACKQPVTAHDLVALLFRRQLDEHQLFFALGESLAHLHYLVGEGWVERETDAQGVHRFRQLAARGVRRQGDR